MKTAGYVLVVAVLVQVGLGGSGCSSMYSYGNKPLVAEKVNSDCRASFEITQPRGEKDVLVILCLSGGGSRAAWFSAASMLRLENVVDSANLLHEVDVISSVSGSSLTSAYYCLTRDPGPYSVVRVEDIPDRLPAELAPIVKVDRKRGLLGAAGKMTAAQRDLLAGLFDKPHDKESVEQLYWLGNHTRAPEVWEPAKVRDVLTRNYTRKILDASFSPLNFWDDCIYWTTGFDRSDQLAKIFTRNLYGSRLVQVNRPGRPAGANTGSAEAGDLLRVPKEPPSQLNSGESVVNGVGTVASPLLPYVPYSFKDLNPERPYLILNSASGTESDPDGLRFGQVFTFTREDFAKHLNSSIDEYDVAHGVMGSAAFPAAFSFVTLRDYRPCDRTLGERYLHVFDGGIVDNMGLASAKKIILANRDKYRHFVVLMVDSHTNGAGASRSDPDPRDRVIDLNFMHSFDILLDSIRKMELDEFNARVLDGKNLGGKLTFWHITFDDVRDADVRTRANRIPTSFDISEEDVAVIDKCVNDLIRPDNPKLQEFLRAVRITPERRPLEKVGNP